jgi:glycosyltransferase involved in cell wall biosynthesis
VTSIVIAAYNEAAVIGRCLDRLLDGAGPGEFDITVVANGCTDDTVAVARRRAGVRVVDRPEPGKAGALNAGDAVAIGFPRIYLDADIDLSPGSVRLLAAAVQPAGRALAASPRRRMDVSGRPLLVRAYFAIHSRLPALEGALYGRGVITVSEAGRARFGPFPDVVADDLFLDSMFTADEKVQVDAVTSVVETPLTTRDLVRRLERVRRGNASLRRAAPGGDDAPVTVRRSDTWSWLRDVVVPRPWLLPAGLCYAAITLVAALRARRAAAGGAAGWGKDESTRVAAAERGQDRS